MANQNVGIEVSTDRIFDLIGAGFDDKGPILRHLASERFVEWSDSSRISITNKGLIEVTKLMESSYAERERTVLKAVYEMAKRQPEVMVLIVDLAKAVEMSQQELIPILNDLQERKGLLGGINEAVWIPPKGIEFLEQSARGFSQQTYRDKEYSVLKKLVEHSEDLSSEQLATSLFLTEDDVNTILLDFKNKGWVELRFGYIASIMPTGKTAFYKWHEGLESRSQPVAVTYNVHNWGTAQIGGQGNTINIQRTNNPAFDNAIRSIVELLNSSSLSPDDKMETLSELQSINKLAVQAPANAFERAKLKITAIETIVKATELGTKLAEYWPVILTYFELLKN
jgi:predicted nucleic-acid-binding protein